jgi:hypothetical protein
MAAIDAAPVSDRVSDAAQPRGVIRGTGREGRGRERTPVRFPIFATLGWAAAVALAILGVNDQRQLHGLRENQSTLRQDVARLEGELGEERSWLGALASPTARVAHFQPTAAGSPKQSGWALYDPANRRAIFVIENLEIAPGHDFELWAIGAEGPRSLGVITVEPSGRALVRLPQLPIAPSLSAFAVSYEAKGGSPNPAAPAGPVVMVGAL